MDTQVDNDLASVLRTLRLAQAQLRALRPWYREDSAKESEINDADVAILLVVKKLSSLIHFHRDDDS